MSEFQKMLAVIAVIMLVSGVLLSGDYGNKVSGAAAVSPLIPPEVKAKFDATYVKYPQIPRGTLEGLYASESTYGTNVNHNHPADQKAGSTGIFGLTGARYNDRRYNPNGMYDVNTLEGSLEIAARWITQDLMRNSRFDSSAQDHIRANQLQVAWNRGPGNMPTSRQVEAYLADPKNPANDIFKGSLHEGSAGIGRTNHFMEGYNIGRGSTQSRGVEYEAIRTEGGIYTVSYDYDKDPGATAYDVVSSAFGVNDPSIINSYRITIAGREAVVVDVGGVPQFYYKSDVDSSGLPLSGKSRVIIKQSIDIVITDIQSAESGETARAQSAGSNVDDQPKANDASASPQPQNQFTKENPTDIGGGNLVYVDGNGDLRAKATFGFLGDSKVKIENGKFVIDDWGGNTVLTQDQVNKIASSPKSYEALRKLQEEWAKTEGAKTPELPQLVPPASAETPPGDGPSTTSPIGQATDWEQRADEWYCINPQGCVDEGGFKAFTFGQKYPTEPSTKASTGGEPDRPGPFPERAAEERPPEAQNSNAKKGQQTPETPVLETSSQPVISIWYRSFWFRFNKDSQKWQMSRFFKLTWFDVSESSLFPELANANEEQGYNILRRYYPEAVAAAFPSGDAKPQDDQSGPKPGTAEAAVVRPGTPDSATTGTTSAIPPLTFVDSDSVERQLKKGDIVGRLEEHKDLKDPNKVNQVEVYYRADQNPTTGFWFLRPISSGGVPITDDAIYGQGGVPNPVWFNEAGNNVLTNTYHRFTGLILVSSSGATQVSKDAADPNNPLKVPIGFRDVQQRALSKAKEAEAAKIAALKLKPVEKMTVNEKEEYQIYQDKDKKMFIDIGGELFEVSGDIKREEGEITAVPYKGLDGNTYTALSTGIFYSEQRSEDTRLVRFVDEKGINYDVRIVTKEVQREQRGDDVITVADTGQTQQKKTIQEITFTDSSGNPLSASDLRYITEKLSGSDTTGIIAKIQNTLGTGNLVISPVQKEAPVSAGTPVPSAPPPALAPATINDYSGTISFDENKYNTYKIGDTLVYKNKDDGKLYYPISVYAEANPLLLPLNKQPNGFYESQSDLKYRDPKNGLEVSVKLFIANDGSTFTKTSTDIITYNTANGLSLKFYPDGSVTVVETVASQIPFGLNDPNLQERQLDIRYLDLLGTSLDRFSFWAVTGGTQMLNNLEKQGIKVQLTKEQLERIKPTVVQRFNWFGDMLREIQTAVKGYSFFSFLYSEPAPWVDDPTLLNILGGPTGELYGWTSQICADRATDIHELGAAFATSLSGAFAHVEGEKATIIDFNASTGQRKPNLFLYKISLKVNPGIESRGCNMNFKVMVSGPSGRRSLFVDSGDGSDFVFGVEAGGDPVDFAGNNMVFAQSQNSYDKVSIKFIELTGKVTPCLDGVSEGDELSSPLIANGPQQMNIGDPCGGAYTLFMPACWGGSGEEDGSSGTGKGVGGTTTSSPARRGGGRSGKPVVNI